MFLFKRIAPAPINTTSLLRHGRPGPYWFWKFSRERSNVTVFSTVECEHGKVGGNHFNRRSLVRCEPERRVRERLIGNKIQIEA